MKSLEDISLKITEPEYRLRPELSYSNLSTYESVGFNGISTMFERKESPSLRNGSIVDELITGTEESFNARYLVAEFPQMPDEVLAATKALYENFKDIASSLDDIPVDSISMYAKNAGFWAADKWSPATRVKKFLENPAAEYYNLLSISADKEIISTEEYELGIAQARALRESEATEWYFRKDCPLDGITRHYQLKFAATLEGVGYRCMADLIIVDHEKKVIIPCDLKTCSCKEWDFFTNFVKWHYQLQARLYSRIIEENIKKDPYFKDFKILNYRFICVNKDSLRPLVWEFEDTHALGTLKYGKDGSIEMKDPYVLGKELRHYLDEEVLTVPDGISTSSHNSLRKWLNTL